MAAPVVVVQGLPPSPEYRTAVLSSCSEALKYRSCLSPDEQDQSAPAPLATAVITWPDDGGRHARVTVERFDALGNRRIDRDTRFADRDPLVERFRTIGLVIAALIGESEFPRYGAEADESRDEPALATRLATRHWIGLAALGGPGLDDGTLRFGADIRAGAAVSSAFFLQAAASHALRPQGEQKIDVRWTTAAVGAGIRTALPNVDLALRAHFELMLEYLHASTSGAGLAGGGSKTRPGVRCGGEILWPAKGPLGFTLGLSAWSLPGGTAVQIDQQKVGSSRWFSYAGFLGAEWSFR
jgi:hypothetical protein